MTIPKYLHNFHFCLLMLWRYVTLACNVGLLHAQISTRYRLEISYFESRCAWDDCTRPDRPQSSVASRTVRTVSLSWGQGARGFALTTHPPPRADVKGIPLRHIWTFIVSIGKNFTFWYASLYPWLYKSYDISGNISPYVHLISDCVCADKILKTLRYFIKMKPSCHR